MKLKRTGVAGRGVLRDGARFEAADFLRPVLDRLPIDRNRETFDACRLCSACLSLIFV
jgi:hypothetical protein